MKKIVLFAFLVIISVGINAQNVGINTTGTTPSANAILDLNSGNNYKFGLIIPHVTLGASLATFSPPIISAATTKDTGLLVYNMNGSQAVGYYYWNGTKWLSVSGAAASSVAWLLLGNASTTPGTNFVGTTDNEALEFKTNDVFSGILDPINKNAYYGTSAGNNTGTGNVALGYQALAANVSTGAYNVAIGYQALNLNATTSAKDPNTAVGAFALSSNTSGTDNTAMGDFAGSGGTGNQNTSVGSEAAFSLNAGNNNTAMGYLALGQDGNDNTVIGNEAMANGLSGNENTVLGSMAMYNFNNGSYNTLIGYGSNTATANNSYATAIGINTIVGANATAIGYDAKATQTNSLILGAINGVNSSVSDVFTGIGTITPTQKLQVNNGNILLSNAAIGSDAATVGQIQFQGTSTGISTFQAGVQGATNYNYTLPTTAPAVGDVLNVSAYAAPAAALQWTPASSLVRSYVKDSAWLLTGNSGTTVGTNYLGTNDANALEFKVDAQQAGWIDYTSPYSAFFGFETGNSNTTAATDNTAMGYQALYSNTGSPQNVAIGYQALYAYTATGAGSGLNTAVGYGALQNTTSGAENTAVGINAMASTTSANSQNTAIGFGALNFATGADNVALGVWAGRGQLGATGSYNVLIGVSAGYGGVNGSNNTFVGFNSGSANTASITGSNNNGFGARTLFTLSSGNYNDAIGFYGQYNNTTGNNNASVGDSSLYTNSAANGNTAIGGSALYAATGANNTALGYLAARHLSTGTGNVAIGYAALYSSIGTSGGAENTAIGYKSLYSINSTSGYGYNNTAVGYQAGYSNSTGIHNTSLGTNALYSDNGGSWNTAVGENALYNQTSGSPSLPGNGTGNTAMGFQALYNNTTSGTGAGQNSAFGVYALQTNVTGSYNTGIGYQADVSTGTLTNASAVGAYAQATSSNSIVLGSNGVVSGSTAITQVDFNGALAPYYLAAYQSGTIGQILVSQGANVAPQWKPAGLVVSIKDSAWLLTGNSGTNPITNWLGTNDAEALQFKTNGQKSGWFDYLNSSTTANTFLGYEAGNSNTGGYNTAIGYLALQANTSGTGNTAMGYKAGNKNTANLNLFIGDSSGFNNTLATGITFIGNQAGLANTTASYNTGVGYQALLVSNAVDNTALGYEAAATVSKGTDNIALGFSALGLYPGFSSLVTTGSNNIGIGSYALSLTSNNSGYGNIAMGTQALSSNSTGSHNIAMGDSAMWGAVSANTGNNNVGIGFQTLYNTASANNNISMGNSALWANEGGSNNIAIGANSLEQTSQNNYSASTTNSNSNTAIGDSAMYLYIPNIGGTSQYNVAVGASAMVNAATGSAAATDNVAVGYQSLYHVAGGSGNTALGFQAIRNGVSSTGSSAVGFGALYAGGSDAVAIGYDAMYTGGSGVAIGYQALYNGGYNNVAIGFQEMYHNTIGTSNSAIGNGALFQNTVGLNNTANGFGSLSSNTSGSSSTALGYYAGSASTGDANVFVGDSAGSGNTSGSNNTSIGHQANVGAGNLTNATAIGANATVSESNAVVLGNGANVGIGTSTPNTAAALDVTSSTQGMLIPRMAANPTGTVTSLLYYNTTSNCFMFYNGTTWQAMFCACSGPPTTPGTPVGPASFCPAGTGTYSITPITGVIYYTWNVPTGSTITSGQGTNSINVTFGSTSGNITVTATNNCGISNPGTIAVGQIESVPIKLTNNQSSATPTNFTVMISPLNFSSYSGNGETATLNNVEFSTGAGGTGTILYAWIESGTSASSTLATTPNASSSAAIVWVNLGTNTIAASGGTLTIYMNFMGTTIMTGPTSYTGEAPEVSGIYGQYDNGALVFPFYDNFAGPLSSNWNTYSSGSGTVTASSGLTISCSATGTQIITSTSAYAGPIIAESYVEGSAVEGATRSYMPGLVAGTGYVNITDAASPPSTSYLCFSNGRSALAEYSWLQGNPTAASPYNDYNEYQTYTAGYNIYSLFYNPTANFLYMNYTKVATGNAAYSPTGSLYFALGIGDYGATSATSLLAYWARTRAYPPSGIMPSSIFGPVSCP